MQYLQRKDDTGYKGEADVEACILATSARPHSGSSSLFDSYR
ncbi:MAG: hypothetical protein AAF371_01800 [Pseudomonadota bacterium]